MSDHRKAPLAQQDQQSVQVVTAGKLYEIVSDKTDIRQTFWTKCGWIGPEEQRRLAAFQRGGSHEIR